MFGLITRTELDRALHRHSQALEMEWSEWYDKFRRLYARLAKRVRDEEAKEPVNEPAAPTELSAGLRQWELASLQRRNGS